MKLSYVLQFHWWENVHPMDVFTIVAVTSDIFVAVLWPHVCLPWCVPKRELRRAVYIILYANVFLCQLPPTSGKEQTKMFSVVIPDVHHYSYLWSLEHLLLWTALPYLLILTELHWHLGSSYLTRQPYFSKHPGINTYLHWWTDGLCTAVSIMTFNWKSKVLGSIIISFLRDQHCYTARDHMLSHRKVHTFLKKSQQSGVIF